MPCSVLYVPFSCYLIIGHWWTLITVALPYGVGSSQSYLCDFGPCSDPLSDLSQLSRTCPVSRTYSCLLILSRSHSPEPCLLAFVYKDYAIKTCYLKPSRTGFVDIYRWQNYLLYILSFQYNARYIPPVRYPNRVEKIQNN